ncbi:MAG: hypothetical protein ACTSRH_06885 [Promethearchaeota archaeon]
MKKFNILYDIITSPTYGIKLIHDEIKYHNLRSQSLMEFFGFEKFTYPKSWIYSSDTHLYDIYYGEYILDRKLLKNNLPDNLICITVQYYEENESQYSINHTIRKYLNARNKNLVIITDEKNFEIRGKQRPLNEEYFINHILSYDKLFNEVLNYYMNFGFHLKLQNSKNLYFHDMSLLIYEITNIEITSFKEFYNNLFQFPFLPIWNFFTNIFGKKGQKLPLMKTDLERLTNFFIKRLEVQNSILKSLLKNFTEDLYSKHIEFLDEKLRNRKITSEMRKNIRIFKKKISNLKEKLIQKRFIKYFNY